MKPSSHISAHAVPITLRTDEIEVTVIPQEGGGSHRCVASNLNWSSSRKRDRAALPSNRALKPPSSAAMRRSRGMSSHS